LILLKQKMQNLAADQGPGPILSGAITEDAGDEVAAGVAPAAVQQDQTVSVANLKHTRRGEHPLEMAEEWYATDLWYPAYRGPLLDFQGWLSESSPKEEAGDDQLSRDK
jgi:hypothetical protein